MGVMAGASRSSAGAIATKMVLPLDTGMNIAWAAQIQVARWMGVVADWKEAARRRVGQDLRSRQWHLRNPPKLYPTRPRPIFGPDAINSRLILIEAISFARRYGELNG